MRILIQRVREASVDIGGERHSAIGAGMLVLTGIRGGRHGHGRGVAVRKITETSYL